MPTDGTDVKVSQSLSSAEQKSSHTIFMYFHISGGNSDSSKWLKYFDFLKRKVFFFSLSLFVCFCSSQNFFFFVIKYLLKRKQQQHITKHFKQPKGDMYRHVFSNTYTHHALTSQNFLKCETYCLWKLLSRVWLFSFLFYFPNWSRYSIWTHNQYIKKVQKTRQAHKSLNI